MEAPGAGHNSMHVLPTHSASSRSRRTQTKDKPCSWTPPSPPPPQERVNAFFICYYLMRGRNSPKRALDEVIVRMSGTPLM